MSKNAKKLTWEILSKDEAALSEDEKKLVAFLKCVSLW